MVSDLKLYHVLAVPLTWIPCSFLWKFCRATNTLKVFPWTGKNEYMILSETDFIAIGGGLVLHKRRESTRKWNTDPCQ